jgi:hypothetical protein
MKRLIVFGPSSSYGIGLNDVNNEVWGGVLSKKLNRYFINNSIPGASDKLISYKITHFEYQPDDIVMIMWAFPDRYSIIKSENTFENLMPSSNDDKSIFYYTKIHEDFDHKFMSRVYMNYALNFLKNKKIKAHSLFHGEFLNKSLDTNETLIPIYYDKYDIGYPRASDDIHVGTEGNEKFALALHRYLSKEFI